MARQRRRPRSPPCAPANVFAARVLSCAPVRCHPNRELRADRIGQQRRRSDAVDPLPAARSPASQTQSQIARAGSTPMGLTGRRCVQASVSPTTHRARATRSRHTTTPCASHDHPVPNTTTADNTLPRRLDQRARWPGQPLPRPVEPSASEERSGTGHRRYCVGWSALRRRSRTPRCFSHRLKLAASCTCRCT